MKNKMQLTAVTPENVLVKVYTKDKSLIPVYHTKSAAGADLRASIEEPIVINPSQVVLVPTGLYCEIPHGYEIQIRPRSGMAWKNHISVLNTPGTIDADYRGEIKIMLINFSDEPFTIEPGMRVAQMILAPVTQAEFNLVSSVEELEDTERATSGFGSTGRH